LGWKNERFYKDEVFRAGSRVERAGLKNGWMGGFKEWVDVCFEFARVGEGGGEYRVMKRMK
jgi:hypothetical protein